jgi:hypothetical protein
MAAKLLHRERSPREPQGEPQSPFLDEELFAEIEGETAEAWASSMVGYQLDTPFQHAFEPEPESFLEPEVAELEERLYEKEAAEEYEFDDEWYDEELDELDDREFDEALKDEDLTGVFAGEEDQAEARGLGGPISGVLGEQRLLEHRGAAESEGFLFE